MATIESTCRGFRVISNKINFRSHSRLTQEESIKLKIKVEKEEHPNREERIEIVNKIIEKIASLDRHFFSDEYNYREYYKVSKIIFENKKYYWLDWDSHEKYCLSVPYKKQNNHWQEGGTLWGLCLDFLEFIKTGKKSNGKNGYGGLYCQNWGYSDQSMKEIQDYAKELGYL